MGGGRHDRSDRPQTGRRLTVQQAAAELGISVEAVRGRIKRGKLRSEKEDGTVYVLLDDDRTRPEFDQSTDRTADQGFIEEHLDSLRDEVAFLRAELERRGEESERKDRIIAGLAQANAELSSTVRALEAGQIPAEGPPHATERAAEPSEGASPRSDTESPQTGTRRPWWRRIFGS